MVRLKQCCVNSHHWYSVHSYECPWCRLFREQNIDSFPPPPRFQQNPKPQGVTKSPWIPPQQNPVPIAGSPPQGSQEKYYYPFFIGVILVLAAIMFFGSIYHANPAIDNSMSGTPVPSATIQPTITQDIQNPSGTDISLLPYKESIKLNYNTVYRTFTTEKSPIRILFHTNPDKVTDNKVIFKSQSDTQGKNVDITRVDENAYVVITVRDRITGKIVGTDGFGKQYSSESDKKISILKNGSYQIELSGAHASVDLTITN